MTPHALQLHGVCIDGTSVVYEVPASGSLARLAVSREIRYPVTVDGVTLPCCFPTMGEVTGLPDPVDGVIIVVSALVADAAKRDDVMSPGELVRDANGVIVGARGLCAYC